MESTSSALDAGLLRFADGHRIGTGGFVETPNQRLAVEHVLPIITPNDLAEVAIAERDGRAVQLGDVANVEKGTQGLVGDAVVDGHPGLLLIVEKYPWGNTLDVTHGVEAALDEMQPGLPGITFDTHVFRVAQRLGLARADDPDRIHDQLVEILPRPRWTRTCHLVQAHGRRTCVARKPLCPVCAVRGLCPWPGKTRAIR